MEAGYQRDRDAAAKSLKIAVKNKKKDSVLYGAVIKMESLYPSSNVVARNADTQTLSSTSSSTQTQPLNKRPEVVLDATVSPLDSISQTTSPVRVGTSSFPFDTEKSELTPVDPRQSNVSVGSAPRDPTPITPPVIEVDQLEQKPPIPVNAVRDRNISTTFTENSSDTSSNTATATAGTYTDRAMETEGDLRKVESKPVPVVEVRTDPKIQNIADAFFQKVQDYRDKNKHDPSDTLTFTPLRSDGTVVQNHRISMKLNKPKSGNWYGFKGKNGEGKVVAITESPSKDGYDLVESMKGADSKFNLGRYQPYKKMGETNGLGLSADHIGSTRVIFKDNKGTAGVAKGQVYVMRPQLIKGHVRLYNRSGRPIVSRSTVSPPFQRLVRDIVELNTFESDDYSNIDPKEAADVNSFIAATKPIQPRNIDRLSNADTIYQLKKRYEVLVGELSAGNTGKLVRDEMETILRSLIRMNSMNADKGRELIRSLRAF